MEHEPGAQHRLGHARPGSVRPAAAEQLRDGEVERPDQLDERTNRTFTPVSSAAVHKRVSRGVVL